jgi:hypothetical protein
LQYYNPSYLTNDNGAKNIFDQKLYPKLGLALKGTYTAKVFRDDKLIIAGKPFFYTGYDWL